MQARVSNNRGFSLIELLIAVVIIMISMLALLSSMIQSSRTNVENDLRNVAIRLSNQTAETLLALPIQDAEFSQGNHERSLGNASQNNKGFPIPVRTIRNTQHAFSIRWAVAPPVTQDLLQVQITVSYAFAGKNYSNNTVIFKHTAN